jgi:hypothetical protein
VQIVTVLEIVPQSIHMDWEGAFKDKTITREVNRTVDDVGTSLGSIRVG